MAYEIKRFPYDGTIDADGHVLEPPELWQEYLEEKYRERALRLAIDDEGFEYLEIDGRPSARTNKGYPGVLGAMGADDMRPRPDPESYSVCRRTTSQNPYRPQRYRRPR